ncbi:hypothetical protein F5984_00230 [Rudanella paleaurantiibacter]|uniref:Outer membrane beta-barrel protein n=1 Tax=Rudanella paleaurantiibacter TaxID=2614655 RepID=A0A7J5U4C6_9BACT|nr:hypothetical protein [Rudanella paleaurantiibacter]KAB7732427.1 hypothetical protein F5984_00230 [Rudanella paleaurantiibacter]
MRVKALLIVLFVYPIQHIVLAQQTIPTRFWVSPGLGKATYASGMLAVGFEPQNSQSALVGRYVVDAEFIPAVEPGIKTQELGLLYGRRVRKFLFAAGLSYIKGNFRGQYLYTDPDPLMGTGRVHEYVGYKTIGIPAEIRYMASLKQIGIGLTAFGNLNDKRSFGGLNLSLYFGKMK